jgi:hypothetical protein
LHTFAPVYDEPQRAEAEVMHASMKPRRNPPLSKFGPVSITQEMIDDAVALERGLFTKALEDRDLDACGLNGLRPTGQNPVASRASGESSSRSNQ